MTPSFDLTDFRVQVPHIDQYFGVWAMHEPAFNGLVGHARQLNVQLHLQQQQQPEAQAQVQARASQEIRVQRGGIALVELSGSLQKQASSFSGGTSTVAVRRQLRAAMNDEAVAGILLHIDSPGGTVAGTDDLARDVAAAARQMPVYAYIEDLGASAAYYVASQATKVFANAAGLVGSIGVFTVVHDLSQLAENQGIKVHVVKFGSFKGTGVPGTTVTDEQLAEMQKLVNGYGEDFVATIAAGRNLPRAVAESLADGRLHKGQAAVDLKLIDAVQSIDETLSQLIEATQKPPSQKSQSQKPSRGSRATDATRRPTMSQDLTSAVATELVSSQASLAQLKKALPHATSDFLVAQIEAEASVEEAVKAYSDVLAKENAALKAELAEKTAADKAAAEKEKPKAGSPVLKDVAGHAEGASSGDSAGEFQAKVDALVERGIPRFKAVTTVARKYPELREAMVAEANPQS